MLKLKSLFQTLAKLSIVVIPLYFLAAALGSKFGIWDWKFGLGKMIFQWGAPVMLAGLVLGVLALLAAFIKPRAGGGFVLALIALAIPAAALVKAAGTKTMAAELPFIHDITTDIQDVPTFSAQLMAQRALTEGVNPAVYAGKKDSRDGEFVSVLQAKAYPDISPINSADAPPLAYEKSIDAVKALGWDISKNDMEAGIIEATDTTFWFGFKDDIVIRVAPSAGGGSVIDMRSLSRVGGSDLGKNAQRVRAFRDLIKG